MEWKMKNGKNNGENNGPLTLLPVDWSNCNWLQWRLLGPIKFINVFGLFNSLTYNEWEIKGRYDGTLENQMSKSNHNVLTCQGSKTPQQRRYKLRDKWILWICDTDQFYLGSWSYFCNNSARLLSVAFHLVIWNKLIIWCFSGKASKKGKENR